MKLAEIIFTAHLQYVRFSKVPLFLAILLPGYLLASEPKSISLQKVMHEALEHNLNLQITELDRSIRKQDRIIAKSEFDTTFTSSLRTDQSGNDSSSTNNQSYSGSAGVQKKFITGTLIQLQGQHSETQNENNTTGNTDNSSSGITLSIRQPLLKDFGITSNSSRLWSAENQLEIARLNYKRTVLDLANSVEKAYWNLAFQNARYDLSKSTIEVAENLLLETKERAASGMSTELDVFQAEANLSRKKEQILQISSTVKDASDQLWALMGKLSPDLLINDLFVQNLPEPDNTMPTLPSVWVGALNTDLNRKIQEANLKSLGYDEIQLRNAAKTDLDLVFSGSSSGNSEDSWSGSWDKTVEREIWNWGIGLELNIPLGKRSAKAGLSKLDASLKKEELRLQDINQSLYQNVRSQWRNLGVGIERLKTSRVSRELEEKVFEQAQVQYRNGLVLFRFVMEAQDSLNRSRISELNAWIGVLNSIADLSRLDGTILDRMNIKLDYK